MLTLLTVLQASDNAKEAEDNARKAKSAVKTVLSTITALLDQLGKTCVFPPKIQIKLKNKVIWLIWHLRAEITDQSERFFFVLTQQIPSN